jgi:Lrp/AsnC family transcriptional regulator for asnA, asnC and gidA
MSSMALGLDEIDKRILRELQRDGRMSYADLAPLVGLSAPATRQRVQRLIESGVLQVVGVTDPLALGLPLMAMLGLKLDADARAVADAVAGVEGVIYVVLTAGTYDLLVEVVCREPGDLLEIVNDRVRTVRGVASVDTLVYMDIHTHRFTWEVP